MQPVERMLWLISIIHPSQKYMSIVAFVIFQLESNHTDSKEPKISFVLLCVGCERNITEKRCNTCGEICTIGDFSKARNKKCGVRGSCKTCEAKKRLEYFYKNHKKQLHIAAIWKEKNREHIKVYDRERRKNNPEKRREYKEARVAREKGAPIATLTVKEWYFIKQSYNFRCVYCGKKVKKLTKDHIIPLSRGGNHTMDNVVPACFSCNSRKKAGPPLCPVQPLLALGI